MNKIVFSEGVPRVDPAYQHPLLPTGPHGVDLVGRVQDHVARPRSPTRMRRTVAAAEPGISGQHVVGLVGGVGVPGVRVAGAHQHEPDEKSVPPDRRAHDVADEHRRSVRPPLVARGRRPTLAHVVEPRQGGGVRLEEV